MYVFFRCSLSLFEQEEYTAMQLRAYGLVANLSSNELCMKRNEMKCRMDSGDAYTSSFYSLICKVWDLCSLG